MRRTEFLNSLEFLNKGQLGVSEWGTVNQMEAAYMKKEEDKGHIGDKYGFLLPTPVGTSKGLEDVDMG